MVVFYRYMSLLCLTLLGCKSIYQHDKNECGTYRIKHKMLQVDNSFYKVCDTASVYQYDGEFTRDNSSSIYYVKHDYKNFYKFYKNGKVGYFGIDDNEKLSMEKMNPCRFLNAYYGYNKKKNYILKRTVVSNSNDIFDVVFEIQFHKDTLKIISKENRNDIKIFLRKEIPKEWLIYKPDW